MRNKTVANFDGGSSRKVEALRCMQLQYGMIWKALGEEIEKVRIAAIQRKISGDNHIIVLYMRRFIARKILVGSRV